MTRRAALPLLVSLFLPLWGCPDPDLGRVFPDLQVEPEGLDFGTLPVLHVGELARAVGNRGQAPLLIHQIEIAGEDADHFSAADFPESIGPAGEELLAVSFRPDDERSYEAVLRIHSNDPEDPLVEIALIGLGETVGAIEIEPGEIDFGIVGEGEAAVETFTIRSVGGAPLVVEEMKLEEGSAEAFGAVGSWRAPATIEPGDSVELSVSVRPETGDEDVVGAILVTSTDPEKRVVHLPLTARVNRAPVAVCGDGEPIVGAPGDVVTLDATDSYDPDGHEPLSFEWDVVRRPLTSLTELDDPFSPTPSLELDVAGTWELQLHVIDSLGTASLLPCRATIRAVAAERLYIELVWDHPITDLDLHVLAEGGDLFGEEDCWWGNPEAFGCEHSGDDLAGYGPEWVRIAEPDSGTYRVVVRFAKTNGAAEPETGATVRVYQYGVLEAEMSRELARGGEVWEVLDIEWPSGRIEAVDSLGTTP